MQGWIKLYRKLLDDTLWEISTPHQKVVMITLLLMASHKENEWYWQGKRFDIKAGEFVTSIDSIARKGGNGISKQNVRSALKKFENYGFLTNKSTKNGRLISICNWSRYQDNNSEANTGPNKDLTKTQQRPNKDPTPINNDKNIKKEKNDKNKELLLWFEMLWKAYPKKLGKEYAKQMFNRLKPNEELFKIILGSVCCAKFTELWETNQFVPNLSTFLNQKRWFDEYDKKIDDYYLGRAREEFNIIWNEHLKTIGK